MGETSPPLLTGDGVGESLLPEVSALSCFTKAATTPFGPPGPEPATIEEPRIPFPFRTPVSVDEDVDEADEADEDADEREEDPFPLTADSKVFGAPASAVAVTSSQEFEDEDEADEELSVTARGRAVGSGCMRRPESERPWGGPPPLTVKVTADQRPVGI